MATLAERLDAIRSRPYIMTRIPADPYPAPLPMRPRVRWTITTPTNVMTVVTPGAGPMQRVTAIVATFRLRGYVGSTGRTYNRSQAAFLLRRLRHAGTVTREVM